MRSEDSLQASLQQVDDPGSALINAMKNTMDIPSKELGDDIGSLTPASVTQLSLATTDPGGALAGGPGEELSEKGGIISKMLQVVGQHDQKGAATRTCAARCATTLWQEALGWLWWQ